MGTKGPSTYKASLPPMKNIAAVTPLNGWEWSKLPSRFIFLV